MGVAPNQNRINKDMRENYQKMWKMMLPDTKHEAEKAVHDEFGVTWQTFRNTWATGRGCPEEHEERLVQIFQNVLRKQNNDINDIVIDVG